MRVLVCGGREFGYKYVNGVRYVDYEQLKVMYDVLDEINITTLITGRARGADRFSEIYARRLGVDIFAFPADWNKHGRSAGPIRNQQMLNEGKPDLVIAFPGGTGTSHMCKIAEKAGVEVRKIELGVYTKT
jgi:hypothetical protein